MCLPRLSHRSIWATLILVSVLLSSCAVGPQDGAERGRNFWDFASIFSTPKDELTPVDDPSLDEIQDVEKPKGTNALHKIPLIGPLLAALFSTPPERAKPPLPGDEELAVDADKKAPTKKFRVPLHLARLTQEHLLKDRQAPVLKVFHVQNGRLHAFSSSVTIRGIAEDASGIAALKINGKPIRLRSRVFAKKINVPMGIHQALIEAEDTAGNIAYFQFKLVRKAARQNAARNRPGRDSIDIRPVVEAKPAPRLAAMREPGVYMVLMAGSAAAHIVKMPNLKKCREAVQFSNNAACTYHTGAIKPG
ncbi:MAG: hypothetical protein HON14_16655 [Rhodospirillaceae bacterium]|jgi:hypothetical protein|nr:hypothetical protein [Rhodospirillaceae bacterium]MBT4588404.1 hypothetical protein [Rhodospirillaceae bacterium]MBT4940770.1 hypothetical protein [Rhodospirillaceae bacterium]MBT5939833.1 hypothetical protein [Rhodospirillaceae bacterium]MBT7267591.1 hypothetical protein [Rhodospirillaceae bacterium]